jgi:hypothetical protein
MERFSFLDELGFRSRPFEQPQQECRAWMLERIDEICCLPVHLLCIDA